MLRTVSHSQAVTPAGLLVFLFIQILTNVVTVLARMMRHVPIVREAISASAQPALKEKIAVKVKTAIFWKHSSLFMHSQNTDILNMI